MNERKQKLREACLAARRRRVLPVGSMWTPALGEALRVLVPQARTVGLYWPLRGEPNPGDFARTLALKGVVTALPVCGRGRTMAFRVWDPFSGEPATKDAAGIPAPVGGGTVTPDVLVVPCVGWSACGRRVGYGGGYYDRWIAGHEGKGVRLIGIGFAEDRIEDESVFEAHDLRMDAVATERGLVMCGGCEKAPTS